MFTRNSGAKYFIPNDDEWFKAAYYDPQRSGWKKYWNYPDRADIPPRNQGDPANRANFQTTVLGEGPPFYVSEVGRNQAQGYYKIYDLGGNVWEWLETWRGLGGRSCWRCDIPTKGLRGGSFNYIYVGLSKMNVDPGAPRDHYFVYGGRLARSVEPEIKSWCFPARARYFTASALGKIIIHSHIAGAFLVVLLALIIGARLRLRNRK